MATIDTAKNLRNALANGQGAINGRSQADVTAYGRCVAALHQAITNYDQLNPGPFGSISPIVFKTNGSFPGQQNTLTGDWVFAVTQALNNLNATCTAAGASSPVAFPAAASGLAAMLTAAQARVTTALALQTGSSSMTSSLNSVLAAMNAAYGSGLPAQTDSSALSALQATANSALATAVTDAQAICTAFGINQTGGGN